MTVHLDFKAITEAVTNIFSLYFYRRQYYYRALHNIFFLLQANSYFQGNEYVAKEIAYLVTGILFALPENTILFYL